MRISIDAARTGRALLIIVVVVNAVALGVQAVAEVIGRQQGEFARQFDVSEEGNLTAWWSASLLLAAAVMVAFAAWNARARHDPDTKWWWLIAAGFVYLSLDEAAELHETLIEPVGELTDASGFFRYAWIIVAIPVVAILGLLLIGFLRRLPPATRRWFLIAGGVFVVGSIEIEALGSAAIDAGVSFRGANRAFVSLEELLENLGVALFIAALLRHLSATETVVATIEIT